MLDRPDLAFSQAPCEAHRRHSPAPTYTESHHIVPQAWQAVYRPSQPWPNGGKSPDRRNPDRTPFLLWDARTVSLCRTGHGNVHFWLVLVMRHLETLQLGRPTTDQLTGAIRDALRDRKREVRADVAIARQGIERYLAVGGDLTTLFAAGEYGAI